MRNAVLVYGREPQRRRVAEAIAAHLNADCHSLTSNEVGAWGAVVDRLAFDRNVVVDATDGEPAPGDAAVSIVRAAVRLWGGCLSAVWALSGHDTGLEGWVKRLGPGADRYLAVAPEPPGGIEMLQMSALASAFEQAGSSLPKRKNGAKRPATGRDEEASASQPSAASLLPAFPDRRPIEGVLPTRMLGSMDRALLEQLRELPRSRALHAFILAILCSPECEMGSLLRENVIAALAHAIVDDDIRSAWTIVPQAVCRRLSAANEAAAVVALARALLPHPLGDGVNRYVQDVAASFESFSALGPAETAHRIFAPSQTLDTSFEQWFRAMASA